MPVPIKLGIFFNKTFVNWLSTNSCTGSKIYTFQIVVQQQGTRVLRLLYGYGTSSILSNIKNAIGNIAGTLDDFGSGSDENKNMFRESEWDDWFCHHFDMSSVIKPLKKIKRILYLTVNGLVKLMISFSMLIILPSSWENIALVIHEDDVIPIRYRYCAPK